MMFELRVLSGLHLGSALPLFGHRWAIGQAEESDLMLSDEGLAQQQAVLHLGDHGWQLEQQETRAVTPEDPFMVGNVWLCVASAETPWRAFTPPPVAAPAAVEPPPVAPSGRGAFPRWFTALTFSLLLLLTFTVVSWILQPTVAQTDIVQSSRQHLDTPEALRGPLTTLLRERDLAAAVSVVSDDKVVTLNGKLNKEKMQVFTRMLARFKADYKTSVPIENKVEPLKIALPFRIVQITTGTRANIVTDNGQRLFIGDEVDDLRLVAITSDRIEFGGREAIKVNW